jgi:ABC-type nickel/cobalt efflux system permease component RcnA
VTASLPTGSVYPLGMVITATVTSSTTPTVLVGALLIVIGGAWMAWSVLRGPSAEVVGVAAQPRVQ